jgi:hypothetical protein
MKRVLGYLILGVVLVILGGIAWALWDVLGGAARVPVVVLAAMLAAGWVFGKLGVKGDMPTYFD